MRRAIVLSICTLVPSSIAAAQVVDSAGFFVQYSGTLTASDTNPLFGGPGEPMVPDQPMHVDLDPDYDWFILETMVSDPVHTDPFYLWPSLAEPFGTHEMGFSMGILGIFCDTNGDDPSDWGTGELLLVVSFGMNDQQNDGHSAMSFWVDFTEKAPWANKMLGSAIMGYHDGSWVDQYGLGYIVEASGATTHMDLTDELLPFQLGVFDRFRVEPITLNTGDMNLDWEVDLDDLGPFLDVYNGFDHDETRLLLADMNDDGFVDDLDLDLFMAKLCAWDLDGSGEVGVADFLELLGVWGPCKGCPADFDASGDVGVSDFLDLLGNWGPCP